MPNVIKLKVGDQEHEAIEQTFEIYQENWNEYKLADGGRVRLKTTVQKIYRILDSQGNPASDPNGDPQIVVRHSTQVVASEQ